MTPTPLPLNDDAQPQELYLRRARRNGRSLLSFRALDYGHVCVVEVALGDNEAVEEGGARSYRFDTSQGATAFVSEAVEALMYLGCEIRAE